jgi:hypothetical protein
MISSLAQVRIKQMRVSASESQEASNTLSEITIDNDLRGPLLDAVGSHENGGTIL